jgi:WD40 repeat protein/DNA-binding XRE family transcriptional regulator
MQDAFEEKDDVASRKNATYVPNVRLKRARELRGWSQADVADKIEAQARQVTRWETGRAFPSPYYRQKLCSIFDQNAEELGLIKESPLAVREDIQPSPSIVDTPTYNEMSVERPSAVEPTRNEISVERPSSDQVGGARPGLYTRRNLVLGVVSGGAAIALGSFWLLHAVQHKAPAPSSSLSELTTLYVYKSDPPKLINYVEWSPHGGFIACAIGDNKVRILESASGHISFVYGGHTGYANCVSWAADEMRVASASGDKTVQVWNPHTGELLLNYRGHSAAVYCVGWSHDGKWIASSGQDKSVQVWDSVTGNLVSTYRGHTQPVWNVTWSPDDRMVASGGDDGVLRLWNPMTAKESSTFVYQGPPGSKINEISWSPDGRSIVSAPSDTTVRIWDARTGAQIRKYIRHTASVITTRWSPNAQLIASAGLDNTVQIWNAATGEQLARDLAYKDEIFEVSWAPDSQRLAVASKDETMHVCRFELQKENSSA